MEPTEDLTPLRAFIPDGIVDDTFPCERCGHLNRCPPVARPVEPKTRALTPIDMPAVAHELIPDAPPQATTRIISPG